MTNKEKLKEEIFEIACKGDSIAVDKKTNKICKCNDLSCNSCMFNNDEVRCEDKFAEWLKKKYVEPCPFEKDELVEVSDDEEFWYLEYFVEFTEGMYKARVHKEDEMISGWKYCRKYGTLGGLVKGEN